MNSSPQLPHHRIATATVVGPGRLGRPLARGLQAAGFRVIGPLGRGEAVAPADVVLLCVPDAEIARVAATVPPGIGLIGHMSGATPLAASGADFGLHPLQSFTGDEGHEAFRGIGCAVAGRSPEALAAARELAERLGGRPFEVADAQRAGYHASASVASNFVVTLLAAAEQLASTAGLTPADARMLLAPLVRTTVANWAELGPEAALTGPIARGDAPTVERQRQAIVEDTPELLVLFDALVASTRALAAKGRVAA
jgi:predicted short-subunit dehydrogenase-like oxidoreductase (DUF2520 family)